MSCQAVSASLMAEVTNAGVRVFVAEITSMCGIGSDGAAALLSACSLVRYCSLRVTLRMPTIIVMFHPLLGPMQ